MTGNEIRKKFLDFFASKGHLILPSASLIPENDPSLLLIGAGMAPFKKYFTGQEKPPRHRIATCQKCVRTGDLENVGRTARHHTFFEMLGNFSFADYFKKEAIAWAWEFMTEVLGLPAEKLWVSVYEEDDEAFAIWRDEIGVPEERIVRLGKDSNFWEIGPGPCGPCSEIYYDLGPERGCGSPHCAPGCDCDRYLEVWNLVFTQFDRDEEGNYTPLPKKNIDTGMGLERIASVMQRVPSNFDTDLIKPIIEKTATLAGVTYGEQQETDVSLKVIADHLRAVVYMVADGILPSNEGRGYVLRRLLRRAVRHGKLLGIDGPFLHRVADTVIAIGRDAYPELEENRERVREVIRQEEERFLDTLQAGMHILAAYLEEMKKEGQRVLAGDKAFRLYDTYGFPLDLTREIAAEEGLEVDEEGFTRAMEAQRERARAARQEADGMLVGEGVYRELTGFGPTPFLGYETLTATGQIKAIIWDGELVAEAPAGAEVEIVLDQTPFYAEGGGQVGDRGTITAPGIRIDIKDTRSLAGGVTVHLGKVEAGPVKTGTRVEAQVDGELRRATARNHTATHLLHRALRLVLGDHVQQAGSLVDGERLRFDFSHFSAPGKEELKRVEELVNEKILENIPLEINIMPLAEAQRLGAIALFGEKYGDEVRVVKIGDYSMELCGGTHVSATGAIGSFKVVSEGSIGAGLRRIEAVTGKGVLDYINNLEGTVARAAAALKTTAEELPDRIGSLLAGIKERDKELEALKGKLARLQVSDLVARAVDVAGVKVVALPVEARGMEELRSLVDVLRGQLPSGIVLLGAAQPDKVSFVCSVSRDLVEKGLHAGNIIKEVARVAGGGGGGRPDMAQAGGKAPDRLEEALARGMEVIREQLGS
ncbi:MAG TPA: alanine--tRNA ligase [Firmicutes bacterium]|nr:alanine--tRNA ligase [Bacillota bacterium]